MKTRQELIEVMAEAMWQAEWQRTRSGPRLVGWSEAGETAHYVWQTAAAASLTALESAGLRIVPQELTGRMRIYVHDQTWANAINASPFTGDPT